jgi:hypothetical protein
MINYEYSSAHPSFQLKLQAGKQEANSLIDRLYIR